jgi:hypothetical protein
MALREGLGSLCYSGSEWGIYALAVFSQVSTRMRRFLYRLPRFKAEIPMDLVLGDAVILGICLDLSESGLRGSFSHPVTVGAEGLITLYHEGQSFQVQARIDALRTSEARVSFRFASEQERQGLRVFMKSLFPDSPALAK